MEKKPIKSNLFRFVTLRSPQLADDNKKEMLFVTYPKNKEEQSKTIVAGKSAVNEEEKVAALKKVHESPDFVPIASKVAYKNSKSEYNYYEKIYQFSNWLMRNKSNLSYFAIRSNLNEAKKLSTAKELLIWENLFYQTIHKKSVSIRESLLQILVANKFLKAFEEFENQISIPQQGREGGIPRIEKNFSVIEGGLINIEDAFLAFTEEEKKMFTQLANASVVIPNEALFSLKKKVKNTTSGMSSRTKNFLQQTAIVDKANTRLKGYEVALKEIERAEVVYNKEEAKKYQEALNQYTTKAEEIREKAPVMKEVLDPNTGAKRQVETHPELEALKISYKKSPEISRLPEGTAAKRSDSETRVLSQLSAETQGLINSPDFEIYDSFNEIKQVIQENIKTENQVIFDNTPVGIVNENINGESLVFNIADEVPFHSYTGNLNCERNTGNCSINMLLKVDLSFSQLVSAKDITYNLLDLNDNVLYSETDFNMYSTETEDYIRIGFFEDKKVKFEEKRYKFKGQFTLSTGVTLSFDEDDFKVEFKNGTYSASIIGQCKVVNDANATINEDSNDETIYGVTQLGIADFRRVEQEVCCYVPGEVSHIENIMAREYKERTTRNLDSHEATNENTAEREAEILTDTTTTQRNELQNEASSIVNEDTSTSFGANASVSGGFLGVKFSAGTNFNTASNSSTSNSNLQAQTYAQEVTERALERVVEKVSSKRTTRILREREETNTHGLDNRKGDKHVTGVYRWVDIIYKNRLVNYGKRLMYEFAIPEPAKFFIDAVKGDSNDSNKENNLIVPKEPIHPSVKFGLNTSGKLTNDNYQLIASEYNAEVIGFKAALSLAKSFSFVNPETGGGESDEISAGGDEIAIPEGYRAISYRADITQSRELHDGSGIQLLIGGHKCRFGIWRLFNTILTDNISTSYSVMGLHSGSISLVVHCELDDYGLKKWQNETYKAIIDAYNERVQEYNEFKQSQKTDEVAEEKRKELSSQLNRAIEKREIKRVAIDLLTAPFQGLTVSESHYSDDATTIPNKAGLQNHAAVVKFFEQAFDWEIMAYTFYPYFYKNRKDWKEAFDYTEGNDPIFKAFLQSGMARSVVPVRPGFEDAVNWFMNTGEIWNGQGMVTDTEDDLYVSVAEEMQTIEGEVEETWETRVPTALTILQAESVVLEEGGLPCGEECKEHSAFKTTQNTLGGGTSADPEGVDFDVVGQTNDVR